MSAKRNRLIPFDQRPDSGRLRVAAVAEVLDVAPSTVYRLISGGQLRAARLGGVTSLKVGDVRALLQTLDAAARRPLPCSPGSERVGANTDHQGEPT